MSEAPLGASVHIEAVSRQFPATGPVVNSVNLTIEPGEFVSFLGPSGCGKSTLLRLIADLDQPNSGAIRVDSFGQDYFRGFVFQEAHLLPWRSALKNAALPLELMGRPSKDAEEAAREALIQVGLGDALDRYPNQLSGGMKMRVSVARALVANPSLLLLDEPFAALDENTRFRLQEDLRRLWEKRRMTVVFVTHSVSEAVFLSDRAVVFSPRPAAIVLDQTLGLPGERRASLRGHQEFLSQVEMIGTAFRKLENV